MSTRVKTVAESIAAAMNSRVHEHRSLVSKLGNCDRRIDGATAAMDGDILDLALAVHFEQEVTTSAMRNAMRSMLKSAIATLVPMVAPPTASTFMPTHDRRSPSAATTFSIRCSAA